MGKGGIMKRFLAVPFLVLFMFSSVSAKMTSNKEFNEPLTDYGMCVVKYISTKGKATEAEAEEIVRSVRGTDNGFKLLNIMMEVSEGEVKGRNRAGIGLMGVNEMFIGKKAKEDYDIDLGVCGVRKTADLYNIRKNICAGDEILTAMTEMGVEGSSEPLTDTDREDIGYRFYATQFVGKKGKDESAESYLGKKIVPFVVGVEGYREEIKLCGEVE
jgi:hypothetical protein